MLIKKFRASYRRNKYWILNGFIGLSLVVGLLTGNLSYAVPFTSNNTANTSTSNPTNPNITEEEKQKIEKKVEKLEDKIADKQDDLETLEQKASNYQKMIDLKKQQQITLNNQLQLMDLQIDSIDNNVELAKQDITRNNEEISRLQAKLNEKQKEMERTRIELGEMIRTYNELDEEIVLQVLSSRGDIATFLNGAEYLDQASQKVSNVLTAIDAKKKELEESQKIFESKNEELKTKKFQLEEKLFYLNNEKVSKDILLRETKGEEAKYQELLERVAEQKQELIGDIDALSDDKRSELAKIKSEAPKPQDGTASTSWYYSQKDPTWGNNRIGLSSTLMKDYGCAVTSLAMVFTYHDQGITPGKLAQQPIFYRDLIVWPQYWKGLKLITSNSHSGVDWSLVDKELKNNNPVIIFVRARGGKGHYVVIHSKDKKGKYIVHDPLFGPNIYLDTTEKLVGAIYNSNTTEDQILIYSE